MAKLCITVLLAVVLYAGNNNLAQGADRSCPGGIADGQDEVRGIYYYKCSAGTRKNGGCVGSDGSKVPVGGTFIYQDSQCRCVEGSDGKLTTEYVGCVEGGQAKPVDTEWVSSSTVYRCVKDSNAASKKVIGCAGEGGKTKIGGLVIKGDDVYTCKEGRSGGADLKKAGCAKQGQAYLVGKTYSGSRVWYVCTDHGAIPMGCMYQGQQMKDGDHYNDYKTNVAQACKVDGANTGFKPFACIGPENVPVVDRRPGCSWSEDGFTYTCKQQGESLVKAQTSCIHSVQGGSFNVNPGCYIRAGDSYFGCSGSDHLTKNTYSSESQASAAGLSKC